MSRIMRAVALATTGVCIPVTASAQRCGPAPVPAVSGVDALVDSSGIATLLMALDSTTEWRYTIVADAGAEPRVHRYAGAEGPADSLTSRIQALVRTQPKSATSWGVRLVVSGGQNGSLALEPAQLCRARRRSNESLRSVRIARVAGTGMPASPGSMDFGAVISAQGNVVRVNRMGGSERHGSEMERGFRAMLMSARYIPAMLDGVSVTSTDTIRVRGGR